MLALASAASDPRKVAGSSAAVGVGGLSRDYVTTRHAHPRANPLPVALLAWAGFGLRFGAGFGFGLGLGLGLGFGLGLGLGLMLGLG